MVRIVEILYGGHIELKQTQSPNKQGIGKSSNWYIYANRPVSVLSRYRFISKVCSGKKRVLISGMWSLELQDSAFTLRRIGYTGYQLMAQYLFVPSNAKVSAS